MKTSRLLLLSLVGAGSLVAGAASIRFTSYRHAPEVRIPLPPAVDSLSAKTNKFDPSQLLAARKFMRQYEDQDWTTVLPDTAGKVQTSGDADVATLNSYTTRVRPARYTKGKLRLSSTSMAEVLVNGESVVKKAAADSAAVSQEGDLEMRPAKEYTIQVNLLSLPSDKSKPEFSLEFEPEEGYDNVELAMGNDKKRVFEIEDIYLGPRVTATKLSPDGKYMIVRYKEMFDADNTRYWSVLQETASGKIISASVPEGADWMPNANRYLYPVKMDGVYDIYGVDVPSMNTSIVIKGIPDVGFLMTPDGKSVICYTDVEGKAEEGVMRRIKSPDDRQPGNRDRNYLSRFDIATGTKTPLVYGGSNAYVMDISRDSRKLLYMTMRETPEVWPFYANTLIEMDLNTLKTDTIVKDEGSLYTANYSPDAKQIFLTGGPSAFGGIGNNSGDHPIPNDFDRQGFLMDIATRKVTPMTRDFNPSIEDEPVWNVADNRIYFKGEEGFNMPVFRLDPKTGKIDRLDIGVDYDVNFSLPENSAEWMSYVGQSHTHAGEAFLLNLKTGKRRVIDDPLAERMSHINFGEMSPWTFTASDGTEIDGVMCLPPDFDSSKKYPLIVYYYGGTSPSASTMSHPYTPQLFASRDYVVYVVNPSGTTGYGQEFAARHVNAWGIRTADDIIEGVKEFCKQHPFVDEKKIGCLGASYGGFMTQLLQTKTDIFAAAVSHAGISNVTSYWGEGYWGYSYNAIAAAKSYPWTNPELFTKQGSLFNADKIHTPLLLLHGTRDTNVPIGESIQLFNALKILGRTVEFITVEDQDHVITDYNKRILWQNTIMAWFAKYLQDDSRWWDSMYGE
ncbi:MAG: S9 family peptidase [Muribaculaceae bacterium]|nr:S9 family peptidase [Muribaculaceae bacterium]